MRSATSLDLTGILEVNRQSTPGVATLSSSDVEDILSTAPYVRVAEVASHIVGYLSGGWWGGVLAGLCFVLPGFGIMLALTLAYAHLGATPIMRSGLNGFGPVVLGVFVVAVYRLGRAAVTTLPQLLIMITAAAVLACSALDIAAILALAAGSGIWLWHSRRLGTAVLLSLMALLGIDMLSQRPSPVGRSWSPGSMPSMKPGSTRRAA